jgi:hypothetical protein
LYTHDDVNAILGLANWGLELRIQGFRTYTWL